MKNIFKYFVFCFLLFFQLNLVWVYAVDMAVPIHIENLEPIPIRVPVITSAYRDYPGPVTLITSVQIKTSGYRNISDLLNAYGGMQVYSLMGNGTQTFINHRGLDAEGKSIVVMLDGVDISSFFDGTLNLKMVPIDSIEKIEIFHGSASSLVGSDALAGLIQITTKASQKKTISSVSLERGAYDYLQSGFFVSTPLSEGLPGLTIDFNHEGSDGFRTNGFYEKNNLFLKIDPQIDETSQFMLSLGVFRDDVGRVGNLTLSQFDLDPTQIGSSAAPGEHTYTQGEMVNFNYLKDFSGWQWRQQLFQQSNQIDSKASFATLIADKKLGAVTEFNLNFDHQVMVLGLEQKYQNATYNDNFGTSSQANQQSRAVYFSQLHHLEEAWGFSYGLRYDDIDWDFVQTGFTNIPFTRRKSNRLSPKLGITYQAQPDQQFFFNYSEAFKAPRPNTFFNVGGGTYFPNVTIDPETAFTYEIGTRLDWQSFKLQSSLYSSKIEKEILFDNITFTNQNFDSLHQGLDFSLKTPVAAQQNLTLGVNYNRSRFVGGTYDGKIIPLAPEWLYSVIYENQFLTGWFSVLSGHYVTGLYDLNDFQNIFGQKSFYYFDYKLAFIPQENQEYFLKIQNLTNEKYNAYPVSNGTTTEKVNPGMPRTLSLGASISF